LLSVTCRRGLTITIDKNNEILLQLSQDELNPTKT
jgi:hypothetical protein